MKYTRVARAALAEKIGTRILVVDPIHPDPAAIAEAASVLQGGGLVAFPTETVYGLGANALDAGAVARIFRAKGRPASDPLIVHIHDRVQLALVAAEVPEVALMLAERFWPGPLTLVLRRAPAIPPGVAAGRPTVAVRMPRHPVALALLAAVGVPIAAPSANRFSRPSPTLASHVLEDLAGQVDLVLDGGPAPIGLESTVLDVTLDPPVVLRPGGVTLEALRAVLPVVTFVPRYLPMEPQESAPAPGMLLRHYSPRAEMMLFSGPAEHAVQAMVATAQRLAAAGRRVGVMAPEQELGAFADLDVLTESLGPRDDPAAIGARLFACMRALDASGVDAILVHAIAPEGLGLAVWDRLFRATEGRVVDTMPLRESNRL